MEQLKQAQCDTVSYCRQQSTFALVLAFLVEKADETILPACETLQSLVSTVIRFASIRRSSSSDKFIYCSV